MKCISWYSLNIIPFLKYALNSFGLILIAWSYIIISSSNFPNLASATPKIINIFCLYYNMHWIDSD